jgi:hypothetical protein
MLSNLLILNSILGENQVADHQSADQIDGTIAGWCLLEVFDAKARRRKDAEKLNSDLITVNHAAPSELAGNLISFVSINMTLL